MNRIADAYRSDMNLADPRSFEMALAKATRAMDEDIAVSPRVDSRRPECKEGCFYCCVGMRVDVTEPEVLRLVTHIQTELNDEQRARVATRAAENAAQTHGSSLASYPSRVRCALLSDDGACIAYSARPMTCRGAHSLNASECQEVWPSV